MKRNRYQVRIRARLLHYSIHILSHLRLLVRWLLLSLVTGAIVGGVGAAFAWGMTLVTSLRTQHPWLLLLLPVSGLAIVGLYRICHFEKDSGTCKSRNSGKNGTFDFYFYYAHTYMRWFFWQRRSCFTNWRKYRQFVGQMVSFAAGR